MKKTLFLLITAFLAGHFSFAQSNGEENVIPCATDEYFQTLMDKDPSVREFYKNVLSKHVEYDRAAPQRKKDKVKTIPVVFHVVHNGGNENISDDKIKGAIQTLNRDFQRDNPDSTVIQSVFKDVYTDVGVEFRLARKDPNGECTTGINRIKSAITENAGREVKDLAIWDINRYLNIWVVKNINSGGQGTILGYATFPGPTSKDGIVVISRVVENNGNTLTHEAGHYLGLYHTFQGGCGDDCKKSGDLICDTSPTASANRGCGRGQNTCSNDDPDLPDNVENHMDYTSCRAMFTKGQKDRMHYFLDQDRNQLYSDNNLKFTGVNYSPSAIPKAVFYSSADEERVCPGDYVEFFNINCKGKVDSFKWYFPGGEPATSTEMEPRVRYNDPGKYPVALKVSNENGGDSIYLDKYLTVGDNVGDLYLPFHQGFEKGNPGSEGWILKENGYGNRWKVTQNASATGDKSLYFNNYDNTVNDQKLELVFPSLNLATVAQPFLTFKVAYARKDQKSSDQILLFNSTNCGKNWIWWSSIPTRDLTVRSQPVSGRFVPGAKDWKTVKINLDDYEGNENFFMKLIFRTGGGNDVYVDDIQVTTTSGVKGSKPYGSAHVTVAPNPATGPFQVNLELPEARYVDISVRDILGRQAGMVKDLYFQAGSHSYTLDPAVAGIRENGIYFLNIKFEDQTIVRKLLFRKQ